MRTHPGTSEQKFGSVSKEFQSKRLHNENCASCTALRKRSSETIWRNGASRFLAHGGIGSLGHDVTLFASGDSLTAARLVPGCEKALRLDGNCVDQLAHHVIMLDRVFSESENFDIIHFHVDYLHFPFSRRQQVPHVTTLHGRLDLPDLVPVYRHFNDVPLISISNAQRQAFTVGELAQARFITACRKGLFPWDEGKGGYLAFLGRTSPEKVWTRQSGSPSEPVCR